MFDTASIIGGGYHGREEVGEHFWDALDDTEHDDFYETGFIITIPTIEELKTHFAKYITTADTADTTTKTAASSLTNS